ncbi:hypothetical protein LUU34_01436500 [Aix galericulata]|nr:hypothetical protein LUU34_01436500 [Aix galericulata]
MASVPFRLLALVQLVVEVFVDDFAFQQLGSRHRGPEPLKAHLALPLTFLHNRDDDLNDLLHCDLASPVLLDQIPPLVLSEILRVDDLPDGHCLPLELAKRCCHCGLLKDVLGLLVGVDQLSPCSRLVSERQEAQSRVWVSHTPLHELQVGEILLCVGVEEALGVIGWVGEDLVHLLVKVAALVGSFDGEAVAVHGVDDAAGGDLGLEQADAVLLDDELLLHGLEEGDLVSRVRIFVASHRSFSRQHFIVQLWPNHSFSNRLPRIPHRVNYEARGSLRFQEDQRSAWAEQLLLHGFIDAHLLIGGYFLTSSLCESSPTLTTPFTNLSKFSLLNMPASASFSADTF